MPAASPSDQPLPGWRHACLRLTLVVIALAGGIDAATAAPCARPDALGTARVLMVSATTTPRVGRKHFPQTLPLADKEVVLTFDDGPYPPTTRKVLAALAAECVQATFFLIGQSAAHNPEIVKQIVHDGHSIGHHSWSHPILDKLPNVAAMAQIERGITADEQALGLKPEMPIATASAPTRFFRFPGFASTPELLKQLADRNIVVFGADLWASDWNPMTPEQELHLITERLRVARSGIILFHDTKARTAAMLPAFLRFLKAENYRVVHVVPATTATK